MTDLDADASMATASPRAATRAVPGDDRTGQDHREFVLLTGMSGAGRTTAANVLEDRAGTSLTTSRRRCSST